MGVEIIYPIAWLVSLVAGIVLVARSLDPRARPHALPTLLVSLAIALLLAWVDHKPDYFWATVFTWFAPVVIVLGLLAHAIRWFITRGAAGGES
jgi:hypothetical protein